MLAKKATLEGYSHEAHVAVVQDALRRDGLTAESVATTMANAAEIAARASEEAQARAVSPRPSCQPLPSV